MFDCKTAFESVTSVVEFAGERTCGLLMSNIKKLVIVDHITPTNARNAQIIGIGVELATEMDRKCLAIKILAIVRRVISI